MPNWKKVIVSGSDARINSLFTAGHVTASGNVSGSSASTASFGRVQASVIGGNSPLKIEADNFNVSSDGTVSGSSTSTGSFGHMESTQAIIGGRQAVPNLIIKNNYGNINTSFGSGDTYQLSLYGNGGSSGNFEVKYGVGTTYNHWMKIMGNGGNDGTLDIHAGSDSNGLGKVSIMRTGVSGSSISTGSFGIARVDGHDLKPSGVARDQVLKWNGNQFVAANYDDTFVFTIADFDMNFSSSPQLIGSGIWKAINALTFTATYNNGPPDGWNGSAEGAPKIQAFVASSASGSDMFPLSSSFASGTNNIAIAYPPNTGNDIRFRLYASAGSDTSNSYTDQRIYFRNYFVYSDSAKNNGFTHNDIANLASANAIISNDTSRTITQSIGANNYLVFAHRTADTNVAQVRCGTGNNVLTVAMDRTDATTITPLKETVSHTNTAGKVENFYVYASKLQNIDAHSTTFTTVTSTQKKNYIFWGTESSWVNNEGNVEALTNKNSSLDDGSITGNTLSVGSFTSKYVIIAIPARYGDNDTNYQFKDNSTNLPFSFNQQSDVTITNAVGFQEDYSVYRSTNLLTMNNAIVLIATV
tara:strand:+ start:1558 stop:3312 length:1755 start_codon:yes stop_codon:yes gene_type:complete